jgi:glycosyltransferase involved in cell wall biosynthesis
MNLLIVTQNVDKDDSVLGFFHLWLEKFSKKADNIYVIANYVGKYDLPENVMVISLGKESGAGKIRKYLKFIRLAFSLSPKVDGVFVHMCPEYAILGGLIFKIFQKRTILWFVHRSNTWRLHLAEKMVDIIATTAKESCALNSKKVRIWGHGIDTEKFHLCDSVKTERMAILSVGRISPIKDYITLIEAARILRDTGKDFAVDIYGAPIYESDKSYLTSLTGLIDKYDLEQCVSLKGVAEYDEMPVIFCSADILVNLCPTGGLDKAVLEAAACGVPILISNRGFEDILGHYSDRLLFQEKNANDLVEKMSSLMVSSDRKDIGIFLRKQIEEKHNLEKLMEHFFNFYAEKNKK